MVTSSSSSLSNTNHEAPAISPPADCAASRPEPRYTNRIGMEFVRLPAGHFVMGASESEQEGRTDEQPAHRVEISQPFYMGIYPVTQAQWEAVMGNNPSAFKAGWKSMLGRSHANYPVEKVSWNDIEVFMRKLNDLEDGGNYGLPTEAQWEYACRASADGTRYHQELHEIAWYADNSNHQTHPVGQKLPNPWGLHDMLGNVMEWVSDWYDEYYYQNSPTVDPKGPESGTERVIRGGSWFHAALGLRVAFRHAYPPGDRGLNLGFRCYSSIPPI